MATTDDPYASLYSSVPLESGEIRLLEWRERGLQFRMKASKLKTKSSFAALSYTWGDSGPRNKITINKQPFMVGDNLFQALQQFEDGIAPSINHEQDWYTFTSASKKERPFKRWFWVDAICINQSKAGSKERSSQVKMMSDIYLSAEIVYVWLGLAQEVEQNRAAAHTMRNLEARLSFHFADEAGWYRPMYWIYKPVDVHDSELRGWQSVAQWEIDQWAVPGSWTPEAWRGIVHMLNSPWWSRAWILQEATIPEPDPPGRLRAAGPKAVKRKVRFVSGDVSVTWFQMNAAVRTSHMITRSKLPGTEMLQGATAKIEEVFVIKILRQPEHALDVVSELDVLNSFRLSACKDPSDKVYATLGISTNDVQEQIVPDYGRGVLDVYTNVVKLLLATDQTLDFLGYVCRVPERIPEGMHVDVDWSQLPSWVPNWDLPVTMTPLPKMLSVQARPKHRSIKRVDDRYSKYNFTVSQTPAYNACGSWDTLDATIHGQYLITSGIQIDSVQEAFALKGQNYTAVMNKWKRKLMRSRYPDGSDFDKALRQVQCADVKFEPIPRLTPVERGYEIDNAVLARSADGMTKGELASQSTMRLSLQKMTRTRGLGLTNSDRLALVPAASIPGDKICMFFGGRVLYVLRPTTNTVHHEFIGEAYVHGIMDGEVSKLVDDFHLPIERFVLV